MTTARDLILSALKKIGVIGVGQPAGPEDLNDALAELNGMIGSWQVNRWLVYRLVDSSFVGSGAQTYTIGPAGIVNLLKRPDRIERAYLVMNAGSDNPLSLPMGLIQSYEDYAMITLKELNTLPYALFYDPTVPLGTLYPWPIPSSAYTIHVLTKEVLQRFDTLNEVMVLPDEYYEAVLYNLCIRLASSYPGSITEEVINIAAASLANVIAANVAPATLMMPQAVVSKGLPYNSYTGMPT